MTDQELIELAAKAVGIKGEWVRDTAFIQARYSFNVPYDNHGMMTSIEWNPLREDSDAFRLMLALGLRYEYFSLDPFELSGQPVCVIAWAPGGERNRLIRTLTETGDEAHAVARRAIVRAAAEIGRKMP